MSNPPLPRLPERAADSHKGDYGRALLIGGSRGMSGAIALAGMAALRSGAGLVTLAVPDVCLDTVASFEPSYMTMPLPCDASGRASRLAQQVIAELAEGATAVACGPGLGRSDELVELVAWLYATLAGPLVVDADGLGALAARREVLDRPGGPRILTPHPGEFARLLGVPIPKMPDERSRIAASWAARWKAVIVLKGHGTIVTDGRRQAINATGNPGMATGGSGDVLTGVVTALVCQGFEVFEAAQLGAHVHGLAGDLAAEEMGQVGMIASDIVRSLPTAFLRHGQDADCATHP